MKEPSTSRTKVFPQWPYLGHGRLPYPTNKQGTLSKTIIKLKLLTFGNLKCVEHLCVELLQSLVTGRLAGPHQGEETTRDVATTAALVRYRGFPTRVQELNREKKIFALPQEKKT
jgi:hypothetical protein